MFPGPRSVWPCLRHFCLMMVAFATGAHAATLPTGFTESLVASGLNNQFVSWSDGGAAMHTVSTPGANTTYTATYQASGSPGTGTGLSGTYFNNSNFSGASVTRIDPTIDFSWGAGAPAAGVGADTFSVRWTGQIEAPYSGSYTFYTQSDEGIRLWINNVQLVNNWNSRGAEDSSTIVLTAGQRYAIRIEYYDKRGNATARLLWSHTSIPKAVVPASRLYPSP